MPSEIGGIATAIGANVGGIGYALTSNVTPDTASIGFVNATANTPNYKLTP